MSRLIRRVVSLGTQLCVKRRVVSSLQKPHYKCGEKMCGFAFFFVFLQRYPRNGPCRGVQNRRFRKSMETQQRRILVNKFDKQQIADLPRAVFEGRIVVVDSEREAQRAVDFLLRQPLLGFDTETRPTFRPGPMHPVALLQVASRDICFLFRLCHIGLPDCLVSLLSSQKVKKVALSWSDDTGQLMRMREFKMASFIELQTYVRDFGIEDMGLQKLYANVFAQKISKSQQLTNWEQDVLTEAQKRYAATDAWACVRLYEELEQLKKNGNWELNNNDEPISK